MLNSILCYIARIDYAKPEDIPNIDLYMDQVTTFMGEGSSSVPTKHHEEDKIPDQDHDQQLRQESSSAPAVSNSRERTGDDLHLLF